MADLTQTAVCCEFNDLAGVETALAQGDVAAILTEPVMTNSCMVLPEPGFHEGLRKLATRYKALLIIDETHTISSGLGGYTAVHGLDPDIFVVGKCVAGGMPTAVWGLRPKLAKDYLDFNAGRLSGHSGMGTGLPGGGGLRLKYSQPIHIDDVAVDFPDMTIILAHPSWPWTDEALSMALHKENIYIDLSGWMPKYFPPQVVQYANGQLRHKMLFGSDFPLIKPDKWIAQFKDAGFKPEIHDLILKQNAIRALRLDAK